MYNAKYLQPQVSTKGLIAHYKLWDGLMATGKIFDYTSTGKGGTLVDTDTPKTLVPTYPGFDFTPTNDYIKIDDHADFSPGNSVPGSGTPFSISAWVYMHSAASFEIISKGAFTGDFDGEWRFFVSGAGILRVRFVDADASAYIGRGYNFDLRTAHQNLWLHLVMTSDGGTLSSGIKLYINGINVDDTNHQQNAGAFVAVENLASDVWIGRYSGNYADGLIDDMMFFNRELDATECKSIYSVTRQRYGV